MHCNTQPDHASCHSRPNALAIQINRNTPHSFPGDLDENWSGQIYHINYFTTA